MAAYQGQARGKARSCPEDPYSMLVFPPAGPPPPPPFSVGGCGGWQFSPEFYPPPAFRCPGPGYLGPSPPPFDPYGLGLGPGQQAFPSAPPQHYAPAACGGGQHSQRRAPGSSPNKEAAAVAPAFGDAAPAGWPQETERPPRDTFQEAQRNSNKLAKETEGCRGFSEELQEMLSDGDSDTVEQALMMLKQPGVARKMSFQPTGCRTVQLAIEKCDAKAASEIAADLEDSIVEVSVSRHGNYVLQLLIKSVPKGGRVHERIAQEICQEPCFFSKHEYGCRCVCRLLESAAGEKCTEKIGEALLQYMEELLPHAFGHHVFESLVEHGTPAQRRTVIAELRGNLASHLANRRSAYVIERSLLSTVIPDSEELANDLLDLPESDFLALAARTHTAAVLKALASMASPKISADALERLSSCSAQEALQQTATGAKLLKHFFEGAPQSPRQDVAPAGGLNEFTVVNERVEGTCETASPRPS